MSAVGDALTLMGQVITPSALLAGASLTALTQMEGEDTPKTKNIKAVNILCAYTAYGFQLASVVGSSITCMRLLQGGFKADADNAVHLLLREFELLFLTVQLCFSIGIIAFLGTIITRTWVIYSSESQRSLATSITILLGIVSLLILRLLISPLTSATATGLTFTGMGVRYVRLLWREVIFKPASLFGVAFLSFLVQYSHTREVKEDRGFVYNVNRMFKRNRPQPSVDGEKPREKAHEK